MIFVCFQFQDRLALAKKRSRDAVGGGAGARKRVEMGVEAFGKADDDEFIIGDGACSSSSSSSSNSDSDAGECIPRLRQIFVCSRTHSQLQQVSVFHYWFKVTFLFFEASAAGQRVQNHSLVLLHVQNPL